MKTNRNDKVKGYKLDFSTNTLTVNYKFHRAMSDFGSAEYLRYKEILADFPHLKVVVKAGRTITTTRPTKRLTYENMDSYIGCYENCDELRAAFAIVRQKSKVLASPYKYVRDWFEAQFPDYRCSVGFDGEKAAVTLAAIPNTISYKKKDTADQLLQYPAVDQKSA